MLTCCCCCCTSADVPCPACRPPSCRCCRWARGMAKTSSRATCSVTRRPRAPAGATGSRSAGAVRLLVYWCWCTVVPAACTAAVVCCVATPSCVCRRDCLGLCSWYTAAGVLLFLPRRRVWRGIAGGRTGTTGGPRASVSTSLAIKEHSHA